MSLYAINFMTSTIFSLIKSTLSRQPRKTQKITNDVFLLSFFFNFYYAWVISGSPFLIATRKACTKCRKTFKYGRSYMVVFFFLSFSLSSDI